MDKYKSVIEFKSYIVKKIVFTVNEKYQPTTEEVRPEIQFKKRLDDNKEHHTAAVGLGCVIFKDLKEHHPFTLDIELIGFFKYETHLKDDQLKRFLEVNATAILFPYLRSLVSNITVSSGFEPIILPVVNVHKMFDKETEDTKKI